MLFPVKCLLLCTRDADHVSEADGGEGDEGEVGGGDEVPPAGSACAGLYFRDGSPVSKPERFYQFMANVTLFLG